MPFPCRISEIYQLRFNELTQMDAHPIPSILDELLAIRSFRKIINLDM